MKYERRNTNVRHKTLADARQSTVAGGFTLIELITVIIIIGIMLGVALPKYMKMAEKTKASNAKRMLDIIRKAEEAYYAENSKYDTYPVATTAGSCGVSSYTDEASCTGAGATWTSVTTGGGIDEDVPANKSSDWSYKVLMANADGFIAVATREGGQTILDDRKIWLNNEGVFSYCSNDPASVDDDCTEDSNARNYWK